MNTGNDSDNNSNNNHNHGSNYESNDNYPVTVSNIKPRQSEHSTKFIMRYNIYSDGTTYNPEEDYPIMLNFRTKKENAQEAKQLMIDFHELGPHGNTGEII
jgi:hypothetical protein